MPTDDAEALGSTGGSSFHEMGFTIEKSTVTAVSRALVFEYTVELAQDLTNPRSRCRNRIGKHLVN